MARLMGHPTTSGSTEQAASPRDDMVIQSPQAVRRCLNGLTESQRRVVLQGPDGEAAGTARMCSTSAHGLLLTLDQGDLAITPMPSLNATVSGRNGLLLFTLRSPCRQPGGLLHSTWPDTIIQVQSRRHFRVSHRLDKVWLEWPGRQTRWHLEDISEEGLGLWLEPGNTLPDNGDQPVLLHLDTLRLPVPALHQVHSAIGNGLRRRVGLRMVGMSGEHLRELRRWLAVHQAAGLARHDNQL